MRGKDDYTHYEKVRILSARALQISQGAPLLVNVPKGMTFPLGIAKLEWEKQLIPMDTRRNV
jgi:DNA-directed RNA polymerase subunit K